MHSHLMAVEGIVSSREVAATETHSDAGQVHAQPTLARKLRLAREHVIAGRTKHAHLHQYKDMLV